MYKSGFLGSSLRKGGNENQLTFWTTEWLKKWKYSADSGVVSLGGENITSLIRNDVRREDRTWHRPSKISLTKRYQVSAKEPNKFIQLVLQMEACNVSSQCQLASLVQAASSFRNPWHLHSSRWDFHGIAVYYTDFPIFIPPALFRFPDTELFLDAIKNHKTDKCKRKGCLVNILPHTFRKASYSLQSLTYYTYKRWCIKKMYSLPSNIIGCSLDRFSQIDRRSNRVHGYRMLMLSWNDAHHLCSNQNYTLPSFNSRLEILNFVSYLYENLSKIHNRAYEEISVYININGLVCMYIYIL